MFTLLTDRTNRFSQNDQKLFYSLLVRHRETQLENYVPDIGYSNSDYHHGKRPLSQIRRLSTRQFSQPSQKGNGRQVSRFTVVSNISKGRHSRKGSNYAPTEGAETVHSYDPFNPSRVHHSVEDEVIPNAKVVVHRRRPSEHGYGESPDSGSMRMLPPRRRKSRSSLASSTRSRASGHVVKPAIGHRRGVAFPHTRKVSSLSQSKDTNEPARSLADRHTNFSEVTDDDGDVLRAIKSPPRARSTKPVDSATDEAASKVPSRASRIWYEDVQQLSTSLAKDCDEAFNRISVASDYQIPGSSNFDDYEYEQAFPSSIDNGGIPRGSSSLMPPHLELPIARTIEQASSDDRPLPSAPAKPADKMQNDARPNVLKRKPPASKDTPRNIDRMVSQIDRLWQPSQKQNNGRRAASDPHPTNTASPDYLMDGIPDVHVLQAIYEASSEDTPPRRDYDKLTDERTKKATTYRNFSAPQAYRTGTYPVRNGGEKDKEQSSRVKGSDRLASIRLVSDALASPPRAPAPLNIRKKSSQGRLDDQPLTTAELPVPHYSAHKNGALDVSGKRSMSMSAETDNSRSNTESMKKKKTGWFHRHPSKTGEEALSKPQGQTAQPKKKGFGLGRLFKKSTEKLYGDSTLPSK
jgi:serine/threonine-protein kinase HSL1 (negative regulator of Swe1 kinase)